VAALAWLPLSVLEALVYLSVLEGGSPWRFLTLTAVPYVVVVPLSAGVWWATGKVPWPRRLSPGLLLASFLAAAVFAVLSLLLSTALYSALDGRNLYPLLQAGDVVKRLFSYLWQYVMAAAVCYAVRIRWELERKRLDAAWAQAHAAKAQLAALRAPLNPHFLFNALHAVAAMVPDGSSAEEAVERLGGLLRYTLDESGSDTVALEEEWRFTRDYLALEQLRFDAPLRVVADLPHDLLACRIPPFTLQPLVENAVRHGMAPGGAGLEIRFRAKAVEGSLELEVRDDGVGAPPAMPGAGGGTGLRDLRDRLAAQLGGAARVELDTAPGKGFRVTLTLPLGRPAPGEMP
jgi:LytS/YehU family sensor histidine kinase